MNQIREPVQNNLPWVTVSESYDMETGEILTKEQLKKFKKNKNYEQVTKQIKYYSERGVNVKHFSRGYRRNQLDLWGECK